MRKALSLTAATVLLALSTTAAASTSSVRLKQLRATLDDHGDAHLFGQVVCKLPADAPEARPGRVFIHAELGQDKQGTVFPPSGLFGFNDVTSSCGADFEVLIQEHDGDKFVPGKAHLDGHFQACAPDAARCKYESTFHRTMKLKNPR